MPAAAVIPAPIGYIKVVAVKKLVVEVLESSLCLFRLGEQSSSGRALSPHCGPSLFVLAIFFRESRKGHSVTESKLECSKQALQL